MRGASVIRHLGHDHVTTDIRNSRPARTWAHVGVVITVLLVACSSTVASASTKRATGRDSQTIAHVTPPSSRVGLQLRWLLGVGALLPLTKNEEAAHFDRAFVKVEPVGKLNSSLASLGATGSKVTLRGLSDVTATSLVAETAIGSSTYEVELSVDAKGLIDGLYFSLKHSVSNATESTWPAIDQALQKVAPEVSFLAARLGANNTCASVHALAADTARPLGSMFKLFVLGALAHALEERTVSWDQKVTLTSSIKVGGSGDLASEPNGTQLTVEQTALKMISESDNTAADIMIALLGRGAVEAQARAWTTHASLDTPFLTVAELFALKWYDYPHLAHHYLSLDTARRLTYLTSSVDRIRSSAIQPTTTPRDIDSIEWFASPHDICRVFAGLSALETTRGLGPLNTVLSTNDGGIGLNTSVWPRVWFKGGSEPGVLTLGYLARDVTGTTFVVVVMLSDPTKALASTSVLRGLGVVASAFRLLEGGEHSATSGAT